MAAPDARRVPVLSLTGVRAVAMLWVLSLHYARVIDLPEPLRTVASGGDAGVSVFFVLSGLVLTLNYGPALAAGRGVRDYARARFARIAPLYWAALVPAVAVSAYGLHATPRLLDDLLGRTDHRGLALLLDALGAQAWVPVPAMRDAFNSPAWSVSTEIGFYAAFPLLAGWLLRPRSRRAVLALAAGSGAVMLALNVAGVLAVQDASPEAQRTVLAALYTVPLLRLPEFVVGALLGVLLLRHDLPSGLASRRVRDRLLLVAAALALAVLCSPHLPFLQHGTRALMLLDVRRHVAFLPAIALVLLVVAAGRTSLHRVLESSIAQRLGLASYAIYLVHWSLLQPFLLHVRQAGQGHPPLWQPVLLLAATLGLGLAAHHWLEEPLRRRLVRRSPVLA